MTSPEQQSKRLSYRAAVRAFKRAYVTQALKVTGGNRREAARLLGLQRTYLHKLLRQFREEDTRCGN